MPHAVDDRLNVTYDVVYHLVRSPRYYFDLNAIRLPYEAPARRSSVRPEPTHPPAWLLGEESLLAGNPGDVWRYPIANFRGAHFATFPEVLAERPILATVPEAICISCGRPWTRTSTVTRIPISKRPRRTSPSRDRHVRHHPEQWRTVRAVGDLEPCGCEAPTRPGLVLDPFFGSGTVGVVAERHGRDWLGVEINPEYAAIARTRLAAARERPERPVRQ
jgi:hypothetical protein